MAFLNTVLDFIAAILSKKEIAKVIAENVGDAPKASSGIDWENPSCKISEHFTVKDAVYLNSWKAYHKPSEEQKQAMVSIALGIDKAVDAVGQELGKPMQVNVHAFIRPEVANCPESPFNGQDYNKWIYENLVWKDLTSAQKAEKRVPQSPHRTGNAVDFHLIGFEGPEGCAKVRAMLLPHLESLGLRMEDAQGGWVHLDNLPVKFARFFKP